MIGFDIIKLISKRYEVDELGQKIPLETEREAFAQIQSISQSEFFEAGRIGLKPQYKAILAYAEDYQGEEIAKYNDKRYAIYRTYETAGGQIELYLQNEKGAE